MAGLKLNRFLIAGCFGLLVMTVGLGPAYAHTSEEYFQLEDLVETADDFIPLPTPALGVFQRTGPVAPASAMIPAVEDSVTTATQVPVPVQNQDLVGTREFSEKSSKELSDNEHPTPAPQIENELTPATSSVEMPPELLDALPNLEDAPLSEEKLPADTVLPVLDLSVNQPSSTENIQPKLESEMALIGEASWYGVYHHGRKTASGRRFDMYKFTAAHKTLPLLSFVKVTNLRNGVQAVVQITDRGPYAKGRILDVSYAVSKYLGFHGHGHAPVKVEPLSR